MSNKYKILVVIVVIIMAILGVLQSVYGESSSSNSAEKANVKQTDRSIDFRMNSFTSPENSTDFDFPVAVIPEDYDLIAKNNILELYMSPDNQEIRVKNKQSGYVWTSKPNEEVLKQEKLNEEWDRRIRSPFLIEYFTESRLQEGSFLSLGGKVGDVEHITNGTRITYILEALQISLSIEVKVDGDALVISVLNDSIVENGPYKLATIQPFPFLGAVKKDDIPGYMFIPDGSGALIRFQQNHPRYDEPFEGRVYGTDYAIRSEDSIYVQPQPISIPVFGMVHGNDRNAFVGIIEDGKFNSSIVAYPSEVNTNFNWVSPKFTFRHAYFQPTSKNMGGINTYEKEKNTEDKQVRYIFLSGDNSNYVGMAKTYRSYLEESERMPKKSSARTDIPLRIEMLAAEMELGLIGSHVVKMTTFDEARIMMDELLDEGIRNVTAVIRGWNDGGLTAANPDNFPIEKALGGEEGLHSLKQYLAEKGIPLYLYTDYTTAFGNNDNFNAKKDGVRKISNEILKQTYYMSFQDDDGFSVYYINPDVAKRIAKKDANELREIGMDAIAIDKTGYLLLSDHNASNRLTRKQSAEAYQDLAALFNQTIQQTALYAPNDYLLKYADQIYDIPMSSSQYLFATDTVPFLQIVLHGYADYYAPSANYNANPHEYLLRMVEYGAYPSYYLTHEPSRELKNTPSSHLFSSYFKDWKREASETYHKMNEALNRVQDATIEDRIVLDWGVVEVIYSNGISIIVNYRNEDVTFHNQIIQALDFAVLGGE